MWRDAEALQLLQGWRQRLSPLPWRYPAHALATKCPARAGLGLYTVRLRSASDTQS
jgi:hypothetical protein